MVVRGLAPVVPVGGDVDLASHEGLYAGVGGLLVELDRPVHHAVVRKPDARHILVLRESDEVPDTARPI